MELVQISRVTGNKNQVTKNRSKWLIVGLASLISVDLIARQAHFPGLLREGILLTVLVLIVGLIFGRRYRRAKWFWGIVMLFAAVHVAVLWSIVELYKPLLESDNILLWLIAAGELWVFEYCVRVADSRYGHRFEEN